jgi:Cdc6-like AAA superfamily ATPase
MGGLTFLHQEREKNSKTSSQIKDFSVFDFNYIPDEPIMRDECKHLIKEMLRFEMSSIPTHQAIFGAKGSGKTLMMKYLQRIMNAETDLNVIYANCREHNTSFKILAHFLKVQARGASLSELYHRFCSKYQGKTVVVLDEIDLMSPKDKRRDILYFLSRSPNPYMIVMLSNNHRVLLELDDSTKSSLQPKAMYFKNYDAQQLQDILRDRARQGLHTWDEGTLAQVAALSTKRTHSDARVAIKTLFYSVTGPHQDIEACFEQARRDVIVEVFNNLSGPLLFMLQAIAGCRSDFAKEIYQNYKAVSSNQREKPFSYVHYYANLSYLQSMGLVALIATKVGCTYANRVMLTFDRSVFDSIYSLRFG